MKDYVMSAEEKAYLEAYDINQFERPSVAADMAVFSIMETGDRDEETGTRSKENYRKDPKKQLKILLIRRGVFPYKDYWALPGGFCRPGETIQQTAERELQEETGVKAAYLKPFDMFSEVDRDPRGWIISQGFLTLINGEKYRVYEGSDAWEAQWFCVSFHKEEITRQVSEKLVLVENQYLIELTCDKREELVLSAEILERRKLDHFRETVTYELAHSEGLAFDHAKIILCAYLALQKEAECGGKIVFDLMPEAFTLTELQKAYEAVLGRKLLVANFRRKIAELVVETEDMVEGTGHRPAKLFRRNLEAFYIG